MFDNIIHSYLKESIVNISRNSLDETVFQYKENGLPILKDAIKLQIIKDIDQIRNVVPVIDFILIGSILTKNYDKNCDMDVSVQVDPESIDQIATAELMHLLTQLNGRYAIGTTHPINYYILTHDFDTDKTEAAYDIINEKWIKAPKNYDPDIEKWSIKFRDTLNSIDIATGELKRDLIDLNELKQLKTKNIKKLKFLMKQKLYQIESLLNQLVNTYKNIKMLRNMAFDRFMTPQEIQMYGSYNKLPENIIYKLLEKYYYIKFIKKLETILDEKDELDLTDAHNVQKAMGDVWKTF